jgi:hypothetical protein
MACDNWKERLVAGLYDELEGPQREELEAHLEACSACRNEMEELNGARESLRLAEPAVPYAPRVVVLERPERKIRSWWSFAAGFACASLLLAVGLFAGMQIAAGGADNPVIPFDPADPYGAVPASDTVTRQEMEAALQNQEARLRALYTDNRPDMLSPQDLDTRFASFETSLDQQRRNDLRFLLQEIFAAEVRSGTAIDETQRAVRYLAVANHPAVSEW